MCLFGCIYCYVGCICFYCYISISQIPSLQSYFLPVSNLILIFVQFLVTGKGEETFEAKDFVLSASIFVLFHVPLVLVLWTALWVNE